MKQLSTWRQVNFSIYLEHTLQKQIADDDISVPKKRLGAYFMLGKTVNVVQSGHAISVISFRDSYSLQTSCKIEETNLLNKREIVKLAVGRWQTCWLFTKRDQEFELGTTENKSM